MTYVIRRKITGGDNSNKRCFGTKPKLFRESGDFSGNRGTWKFFRLNSSPIDKLGSWCHPRLVRALCKYQAQQGGSMATLWAGTSPASGHQPAPSHWRNFSGNLPYPMPTLNHFLWGWEGGWGQNWQNRRPKQRSTTLNWGSKLQIWWPSSDPSKVVICTDQRSRQLQLWRLEPKARGEANPCGHPTYPGDRWMHWLEINFA